MQALPDQQLSPHFRLSEFLVSREAVVHGIDNTPGPVAIANLTRLARELEVCRVVLGGVPMSISSGFRCPPLNAMVKGAVDSAHLDGRAADFTAPGFGTPQQICQRLIDTHVDFDQLIFEGTWVHFGIAEVGLKPRGQVLTAVFTPGARTRYLQGIVH